MEKLAKEDFQFLEKSAGVEFAQRVDNLVSSSVLDEAISIMQKAAAARFNEMGFACTEDEACDALEAFSTFMKKAGTPTAAGNPKYTVGSLASLLPMLATGGYSVYNLLGALFGDKKRTGGRFMRSGIGALLTALAYNNHASVTKHVEPFINKLTPDSWQAPTNEFALEHLDKYLDPPTPAASAAE